MTFHALDSSYAGLPDRFFRRVRPAAAPAPKLIKLNRPLVVELGLNPDQLEGQNGAAVFSGQRMLEGADPIALAYAGHQFGNFVPQLGDGRAILLGDVIDRHGKRRDIQLKGAGPTPFSRGGDGRAALGPVLREYLISEAMAALGIPTTRALAAVTTGDMVYRETPLPGAIVTRVAASHVRVGTFQFFAARGDLEALRLLADHVLRHYPAAAEADRPYAALLEAIAVAQADLVARWLLIGFIHGVMNTDNMSVAGETIDYGPCAFMDAYDPATVFSSIDRMGRYAYGNQPRMAQWNLTRLAEAMLPILSENPAEALELAQVALGTFSPQFESGYHGGLAHKLGLRDAREEDRALAGAILTAMVSNQVDFTLFFRRLGGALLGDDEPVRALFVDPTAFDAWAVDWRARLAQEPQDAAARRCAMDAVNPGFIPRNHLVEAMIVAAVERDDFGRFDTMLDVLSRPYEDQPHHAEFSQPPKTHERVLATFCGT
ncbi:protein adenylyltransferase SelO [Sphingomonas sp. PB4P5]|uniref:protein adenylyltransferase SelO n=1 Tax=Parasphingomonas puruogangriensis TaxID=3096155 RepID=UPI002FCC048C